MLYYIMLCYTWIIIIITALRTHPQMLQFPPQYIPQCTMTKCASLVLNDNSFYIPGILFHPCDTILHSQLTHLRQCCQVTPLKVLCSSKVSEDINNVSTIHQLAIIYGGQTSQSICSLTIPDTSMTWYINEGNTVNL